MILYHTSDRIIEYPDIKFSRTYLDFGKGFYTTPNQGQAEKYAKRLFKEGRHAYLNVYEFDDNQNSLSRKIFDAYDGEWLDYVVQCRQDKHHMLYGIVEGGIADDDVFNTLDLYMDELISREEAIKRLRKKRPNWQICFCDQNVINNYLHFVKSTEIIDDER